MVAQKGARARSDTVRVTVGDTENQPIVQRDVKETIAKIKKKALKQERVAPLWQVYKDCPILNSYAMKNGDM